MGDIFLDVLAVGDATLRVATPLIFCAMAGLFSERSGVIDISLEGKLLASAFAAGCIAAVAGSAWLALMSGIAVSAQPRRRRPLHAADPAAGRGAKAGAGAGAGLCGAGEWP
jgi:hypothetical protein